MKEPKIEGNPFEYKGFLISIDYDNYNGLYYGKILKNDSSFGVVFQEKKKEVLNEKICEAIDDYEDSQMKAVEMGENFYKGSSDDIMYSITIGEEWE